MQIRPHVIIATTLIATTATALAEKPDYPETRTENIVETIHGYQIADPYRWLEGNTAEVMAWREAQNDFTMSYLIQFPKTREAIAKRINELIYREGLSAPTVRGDKTFVTKRDNKQDHSVLYVKDSPDGEYRVLIDPNQYPKEDAIALSYWHPTEDGTLLAYGLSQSGSENATIYVMNVDTGEDLGEKIPNCRHCALIWDEDNQGFHYTRYPIPGTVSEADERLYRRIFYHKLGTDFHDDPLIFGEGLAKEAWCGLYYSGDRQYHILVWGKDWRHDNVMIKPVDDDKFRGVAIDMRHNFQVDVFKDKLYIRTDYQSPRYRIMIADADNPSHENWKELIPQQKGIMNHYQIVGGKLLVHVIEDVHSRVFLYNLNGTLDREIKLPGIGSAGGFHGRATEPDLYYNYGSFTHPYTKYHYNVETHESEIYWQQPCPIDPDQYVTKQVWFKSKDGTRVPMFVMHKKGIKLDGNNPTILDAYGGFNNALLPGFSSTRFVWLEKGGVFVIANIRGGGEFGADWHSAGRRENKQNCFDDFIAAAEKLIADGYTCPQKLAANGGSNGGLLMGGVMTQRPDLFKAINCGVPLLDMLRFHKFGIAALYTAEYGDPDVPDEFRWLYGYSPYHHVKTGVKYPAVFFGTSDSDTRVHPMHASKMAARMQAETGSDAPILLYVESKAGHGAGMPLSRAIEKQVDFWTFMMWQLGMIDE